MFLSSIDILDIALKEFFIGVHSTVTTAQQENC